jgi:hypothetical protein
MVCGSTAERAHHREIGTAHKKLLTPAPQSWGYRPALPGPARRGLTPPFYVSLALLNNPSGTIFYCEEVFGLYMYTRHIYSY